MRYLLIMLFFALIVSIGVDAAPPVIHEVSLVPSVPEFGNVTFIKTNVTDDTGLFSVNYTVTNPTGSKIVDNVNATIIAGLRNSQSFTVNKVGTWQWSVVASDQNTSTRQSGNFTINNTNPIIVSIIPNQARNEDNGS
ncbi:MAG: hypothetical protein ABH879_04195, partial [archaeon]